MIYRSYAVTNYRSYAITIIIITNKHITFTKCFTNIKSFNPHNKPI